jgi:hypothetical protein
MFAKIQAGLDKLVGPNAAHVLDGLIAFEITAGTAALASPSARAYGAHHPLVALGIAVGTPLLTALASKFRKAATTKTLPPAPPA